MSFGGAREIQKRNANLVVKKTRQRLPLVGTHVPNISISSAFLLSLTLAIKRASTVRDIARRYDSKRERRKGGRRASAEEPRANKKKRKRSKREV